MTDNGLAALAAAMTDLFPAVQRDWWPFTPEQAAAAILGERGVFLPDGHPLGVEDAIAQGQARIAALNARIVDLNAEVLDRMDQWYRDSLARDELARQQNGKIATLRAALDRLACYADAASDCPYPMHDPEKCDHRYILREEVALARSAIATAKEAGK
jgi:hypothetical protein